MLKGIVRGSLLMSHFRESGPLHITWVKENTGLLTIMCLRVFDLCRAKKRPCDPARLHALADHRTNRIQHAGESARSSCTARPPRSKGARRRLCWDGLGR